MSEYKIIKGTADDFSRMSENVEALIKTSCGAKAVRYFGQLIHGAPWQENENDYAIIALRQRVPVCPTFGAGCGGCPDCPGASSTGILSGDITNDAVRQELEIMGDKRADDNRLESDLNACIGQTVGIDVQANDTIKIQGADNAEKQAIADCLVRSWGSEKPVDGVPIKVSISIDGKPCGGAQCDTMEEASSLVNLLTDTIKRTSGHYIGNINIAAINSLEQLGYTYHGGQIWKPPVGEAPAYITGWDGKGFPPVGVSVEFKSGNRWYPATVTAITEQIIVLKDQHGSEEATAINLANLRPSNYEFDLLLNDIKAAIDKNNCYTNADELITKQLLSNGWRKI